jgi:hypothetical protein
MRVTPRELNSVVSTGCCHELGTNDIAARLYTSSGCVFSSPSMSES